MMLIAWWSTVAGACRRHPVAARDAEQDGRWVGWLLRPAPSGSFSHFCMRNALRGMIVAAEWQRQASYGGSVVAVESSRAGFGCQCVCEGKVGELVGQGFHDSQSAGHVALLAQLVLQYWESCRSICSLGQASRYSAMLCCGVFAWWW